KYNLPLTIAGESNDSPAIAYIEGRISILGIAYQLLLIKPSKPSANRSRHGRNVFFEQNFIFNFP
ncbi:MAG: hypothetical protein LBC13_00270, partial [Clostridiales bacterium]|nr:hypothetical protein [Clostridiales bacterium]